MADQIQSYWDILKPNFEAINIYEGRDKFFESCDKVPRLTVLLYATHMCASEVHNGGFLQLFWNNTGIVVPEAIEGYRVMGMPDLANLLESTAKLLGEPYPRDRDGRWDALLRASGRVSEEVKAIFERNDNLYSAFLEATKPLKFDPLDERFWDLAASEAGGYGEAATKYARSVIAN